MTELPYLAELRDTMWNDTAFDAVMMRLARDHGITTQGVRKIATAFIGLAPKARVRFEMLRRIADHQAGRIPRTRKRGSPLSGCK
jgi:hypothetical protein